MENIVRLVGPNHALEVLGVKLVGVHAENGTKLLVSLVLVATVLLLRALFQRTAARLARDRHVRVRFWARQGINLATAVIMLLGITSVWFDDPTRLTTALGLVTAGLAFALRQAVTAFVGYFVILRGRTFSVGDRIMMGGVRGDVVRLGFMQTQIMEMGQPDGTGESGAWVRSRQYTGRLVTVTNDQIFTEPVYNYTRELPFLWEELRIPIRYDADLQTAERIMLDSARRHSARAAELGAEALAEMQRRYFLERTGIEPAVYVRLTDNWVELTVRFVVPDHGIRDVKNRVSRDILAGFAAAGLEVASATFEVVAMPELRARLAPAALEH